jgi:hypothetical protein
MSVGQIRWAGSPVPGRCGLLGGGVVDATAATVRPF